MSPLMESDLHALPNLGRTTVQWLRAVGIHSRDELERRGPVTAFRAMRDRGFRTTKAVLYSLHAALTEQNWRELSDGEKTSLLEELGVTPQPRVCPRR